MSRHPDHQLAVSDIPAPRNGASRYSILRCATGGFDIFVDGRWFDRRPSEQAALREAIRHQKRANVRGDDRDA